MLLRSMETEFLHRVIEDPAVKPWVTLGHEVDLTDVVKNPDNVFLANPWGGFLFVKDGDCYECHSQFLPEGRGKKTLEAAREAAWYIFTRTPALAIRTYVPRGNVAAAALARRMGFSVWGTVEYLGTEMTVYMLTLKEWARGLGCRQH